MDEHMFDPSVAKTVSPLLSREHLRAIAEKLARDHLSLASRERDLLRRLVMNKATVRGFTDPLLAPPSLLGNWIREAAAKTPYALVLLWVLVSKSLFDSVSRLAVEQAQALTSEDDVGQLAQSLAKQLAPAKVGEIEVVMLCLRESQRRKVENGADDSGHPLRFATWLVELAAEPSDSDAWSHLDWLIEEMRRVAAEKAAELEMKRRAPLRQAIARLARHLSTLDALDLRTTHWSAEACDRASADRAIALLTDFDCALAESARLEGAAPASLVERRARLQQQIALLEQIKAQYDDLDGLLGVAAAPLPDDAAPPTGGEHAQIGSPAASIRTYRENRPPAPTVEAPEALEGEGATAPGSVAPSGQGVGEPGDIAGEAHAPPIAEPSPALSRTDEQASAVDLPDEEPLSPTLERVMNRMRRLRARANGRQPPNLE